MKRILSLLLALALAFCCGCCAPSQEKVTNENESDPSISPDQTAGQPAEEPGTLPEEGQEEAGEDSPLTEENAPSDEQLPSDLEPLPPQAPEEDPPLICIDAGHQIRGNSDKEPNGPGSSKMKAKVTGGTRGTTTGLYEYELVLEVALLLQAELEARGYEVVMSGPSMRWISATSSAVRWPTRPVPTPLSVFTPTARRAPRPMVP